MSTVLCQAQTRGIVSLADFFFCEVSTRKQPDCNKTQNNIETKHKIGRNQQCIVFLNRPTLHAISRHLDCLLHEAHHKVKPKDNQILLSTR